MIRTALRFFRDLFRKITAGVPFAVSNVKGFTIEVNKKAGCVLQARTSESKEAPLEDVGSAHHFEAVVTYDGHHPLYPSKPESWTFLLTKTVKRIGEGMTGAVYYLPPGESFHRIKIIERYDEAGIDSFGLRYPAQHGVWVQLYSQSFGKVRQWMGVGIMSRKPSP